MKGSILIETLLAGILVLLGFSLFQQATRMDEESFDPGTYYHHLITSERMLSDYSKYEWDSDSTIHSDKVSFRLRISPAGHSEFDVVEIGTYRKGIKICVLHMLAE